MPMGRLQLSQVNRTNTLNKSLRVADVSEDLKKIFGGKYPNEIT